MKQGNALVSDDKIWWNPSVCFRYTNSWIQARFMCAVSKFAYLNRPRVTFSWLKSFVTTHYELFLVTRSTSSSFIFPFHKFHPGKWISVISLFSIPVYRLYLFDGYHCLPVLYPFWFWSLSLSLSLLWQSRCLWKRISPPGSFTLSIVHGYLLLYRISCSFVWSLKDFKSYALPWHV